MIGPINITNNLAGIQLGLLPEDISARQLPIKYRLVYHLGQYRLKTLKRQQRVKYYTQRLPRWFCNFIALTPSNETLQKTKHVLFKKAQQRLLKKDNFQDLAKILFKLKKQTVHACYEANNLTGSAETYINQAIAALATSETTSAELNTAWFETTFKWPKNLPEQTKQLFIQNESDQDSLPKNTHVWWHDSKLGHAHKMIQQQPFFVLIFLALAAIFAFATSIFSPWPLGPQLIYMVKHTIGATKFLAPWLMVNLVFISALSMTMFHKHHHTKNTAKPLFNPDNLFADNPIKRLCKVAYAVMDWFYRYGLNQPIAMTLYTLVYFGTIWDLLQPFLPWHNINLFIMTGIVNPTSVNVVVAAICTGFMIGKITLLLCYIASYRMESMPKLNITKHTINNLLLLGGLFLVVFIESHIPFFTHHLGRWFTFDLITWNIKPCLFLFDTLINPRASIIGSTLVILGLPFIAIFHPQYRARFWPDLWKTLVKGLRQCLCLPLGHLLLPILHVLFKGLLRCFTIICWLVGISKISNIFEKNFINLEEKFYYANHHVGQYCNIIEQFCINQATKVIATIVMTLSILGITNVWICPIFTSLSLNIAPILGLTSLHWLCVAAVSAVPIWFADNKAVHSQYYFIVALLPLACADPICPAIALCLLTTYLCISELQQTKSRQQNLDLLAPDAQYPPASDTYPRCMCCYKSSTKQASKTRNTPQVAPYA